MNLYQSAASSKCAHDVAEAPVLAPGCKPLCVDQAEDVDIPKVALKIVK